MPVHPYLEPLLASLPPMPEVIEDWEAYRREGMAGTDALFAMVGEPGPDMPAPRQVQIDVDGGAIDLLIYRPEVEGTLPVHVFLHGGGWVAGDIHTTFIDAACRERAVGAECVVVAVNYRKAPEHSFPTPLLDCVAALKWVVVNAGDLGVDTETISIGGQSAGANLGAGLALKMRDEGGPVPTFLLLEVPALDLTLSGPTIQEYGTGYGLSAHDIGRLVPLFMGDEDPAQPYASPLLAEDLADFPPTHIMVAEYDPLRSDGVRFAERLLEAGVRATCAVYDGHIHGSSAFTAVIDTARDWRAEALGALRQGHRGPSA